MSEDAENEDLVSVSNSGVKQAHCGRVYRSFKMTSVNDITTETEEKERKKCNSKLIFRLTAVISTILCVIFIIVIIILAVLRTKIPICSPGYSVIPRDMENPRVFDSLTPKEMRSISDYLLGIPSLNLVPCSKALPNSSYIFMIDLLMPLKDAVLRHLIHGNKQPERTAKVVIVRGDLNPAQIEEYHVGPLPVPSYYVKVTNPSYAKNRIPYTAKPTDSVEYKYLHKMLGDLSLQLYPLIYGSYGLSYHNCTKDVNCLTWWDTAPRGRSSGERRSWFGAFRDVEGFYLHPLGLEVQIDHASTQTSDWKITRIVYNSQLFYEPDELLRRYVSNKDLRQLFYEPLGSKEYLYSSYTRRGQSEMPDPLQGPKLVEPDGRRYNVDGNHISYMHWDFNLRMRTSSGLQLFDIRFQEERIAYEISLQDAVVFYSGYGPFQGTSNYYDNSWLMGSLNYELVPGVDCPETAVFLDADFFVSTDDPFTIKNAICIFEHNSNLPLRRHYSASHSGYTRYTGLSDYNLVVRTVSTIWNYDYIFDYIFHQNGAVEVKISLTGYPQAAYGLFREKRYGYPIYTNIVANIHQHLFHYKVDLDINGPTNRYGTLDISTENVKVEWHNTAKKTQMVFEKNVIEREMDAGPGQLNNSNPKYDVIFNDAATSKFGSKRSYRILNLGKTDFLLSDSDVAKSAQWAKYHLAITQYRDTEEMSTSIYAQNDPWSPIVDFDKFIQNNESIKDKDIVAWVTMGITHIPHTEDVPSTTTAGSQLTFYLLPFNYFTECPSVSSPNTVKITPRDKGVDVNTYGTSFVVNCAQKMVGPENYDGKRKYDI